MRSTFVAVVFLIPFVLQAKPKTDDPIKSMPWPGNYEVMRWSPATMTWKMFDRKSRLILEITEDGLIVLRGKIIGRDVQVGQAVRDAIAGANSK